ncbi:MAG: lipid A biosynthesis acyltransferase [Bacteroidetes bacterium]|nr:lipid A biosynthesis acyltransferase [Bacteroidota bacterium]
MQQQKWQGKSSGGVLGYRIFVFLLKNTGLRFSYFFLHIITFFYFLFSKANRSTYYYFKKIQGYPTLKAIMSIYQCYYVFGQTLLDKFAFLSGAVKTKFSFVREGQEELIHIHKQKKGCILVSAHTGNWEVAGQFLNAYDKLKFNMLVYDNEAEQMKKYVGDVLKNKQINLISMRHGDIGYLVELHRAFSEQEWLVMHGDRFTSGAPFIEKTFLGKKAKFPIGPFILAAKFGVPVLFSCCMKESRYGYKFYAQQGSLQPKARGERATQETVEILSNEYIAFLEKIVKKYPLQWFNFYEFWEH